MDFNYLGAGRLGGSAEVELFIDGVSCGKGQLPRTISFIVPQGEDFMVGADPETPVSHEYEAGNNAFVGKISWVRINSYKGARASPSEIDKVLMATQ